MISIVIPYHDMDNAAFFMKRCIDSIMAQTYKDYEIILVKEGKMAENTNAGIKKAKGDIIKILFLDDYLAHPKSLENLVSNFKGGWLATGCLHDDGTVGNPHYPTYSPEIKNGKNTIGSPSVVAFENNNPLLFDENLSWTLDCDLYTRLYERYGEPTLVNSCDVVIGLHAGQTTNILTEGEKIKELDYLLTKHGYEF